MPPTFTFGSTGLLAKQLAQGAPFDVFAAANESYVEDVVTAGACDGATKSRYARGRLVVWWRRTPPRRRRRCRISPMRASCTSRSRTRSTRRTGARRSRRCSSAGVLPAVQPKLVFGENVQQALQSAETGNADVAIVALSLAIRNTKGSYVSLDQGLHEPIEQAMVVCRHGHDTELGKEFSDFVASKAGRAIMQRYGFLLPGESLAAGP